MPHNPRKPGDRSRRIPAKPNHVVTKSGSTIKLHGSLADRMKARRDAKALRKAEMLRDMPKSRFKRVLYRLHPKRMYKYWFSKEGAIMALKLTGVGIFLVFILMIGVFAYFRKDLPDLKDISGNNIGGSIRYYDKSGQTLLWEDYDAVKRIPVKYDQISQSMKDATIAIEDRDFKEHGGFDVKGITRAAWSNLTGGETSQGGSTITQQLVKLTRDWTEDRTYTRKIKELILAVELEHSYSKDEILNGYLNTAPYGGIEYGVEAASQDYFQKPAKELTLDESAFLAAIPKSPTLLSPYSGRFDRKALLGRQQYVLDQMADMGTLTATQRDEAKKVDVLAKVKPRNKKYDNIKAPYFVTAAKSELEHRFTSQTVKRGGWKVTTTLDMGLQKLAEDQVAKGIAQVRRQGGDNAAFAASDVKTGHMVALVGGIDFKNQKFGELNYATAPLPPGSSFKPYDYVALIDNTTNFGAGSVLYDTQGPIPGYPCTNKSVPTMVNNKADCLWDFDRKYPGPVTIRYALGGSRNVPAVKAMLIAGEDKVISTAEKLGLTSGYKCYNSETFTSENETKCYASSAIGDGAYLHLDEHVNGYASLARNGTYIPKTYILKIEDASNKNVYEWKAEAGTQAVRPDAAYIVSDMLSDPNASYFPATNKPQRYKTALGTWKFSLKTGTTNDAKDGWMMGYSSQFSAGVWVGEHNRSVAMTGSMESMTLPIWQGWMRAVHEKVPVVEQQKPSGVKSLPAFIIRNHVGFGSVEPSPANDLYPSWYQQTKKSDNKPQTIDQVSNKLATECTPERAKKTETGASANVFSGDTFVGGGNNQVQTDQKDDVHKCTDARPGITLDVNGAGGAYILRATVTQGSHPLNSSKFPGTVNFKVNGQTISGGSFNVTEDGQTVEANYTPTSDGSFEVSAEVIDSVLYDATDTRSGFSMNSFKVTANGKKNVSISWNSLGSGYTYTACVDGGSCQTTTATAVVIGDQTNTEHTVTVTAKNIDGTTVTGKASTSGG